MVSEDIQRQSRFLSLVLRHAPEKAGVSLGAHGWVLVDDLLAGCARAGQKIDRATLAAIVATSDKKRFTLSADKTRIRAAQGHSVTVDLGLDAIAPPDTLFHGTAAKTVTAILSEGLRPGNRQQVHLSADQITAAAVGARHGKPVVLSVAAAQMHRDNYAFYSADNGVWLTDGVPPGYITLIES